MAKLPENPKDFMRVNNNHFDRWAQAQGNDFKFTRIFVKQEALCLKYPQQLEPIGINPLTTRLCLAQEAFLNLHKLRLRYRQKTREDYKTYELKSTDVSGMPAPAFSPTKGLGEVVEMPLIEPHKNLYVFCSFLVSALDRLAFEINLLYGLGISENRIDWGKFGIDRQGNKKEGSKKLSKKNITLEKLLMNFDFGRLLKYRNVLEHRGFLEIKPGNLGTAFDFLIQKDPDSKINIFNTPVVEYCKGQFVNALRLCNDVYSEIYRDANNENFNFPIR